MPRRTGAAGGRACLWCQCRRSARQRRRQYSSGGARSRCARRSARQEASPTGLAPYAPSLYIDQNVTLERLSLVPVEALRASLPKQLEPLPESSRVPFGAQEIQPESEHFEHSDSSHAGLRQQVAAVAIGVVALDLVGGILGVEVPAQHRLELR